MLWRGHRAPVLLCTLWLLVTHFIQLLLRKVRVASCTWHLRKRRVLLHNCMFSRCTELGENATKREECSPYSTSTVEAARCKALHEVAPRCGCVQLCVRCKLIAMMRFGASTSQTWMLDPQVAVEPEVMTVWQVLQPLLLWPPHDVRPQQGKQQRGSLVSGYASMLDVAELFTDDPGRQER